MIKLTFLKAGLPLTKTIKADGTKTPYPFVSKFTSEEITIKTLADFYKHLVAKAADASKPCLLKGNLSEQIVNAPRKGLMPPNTQTRWVCFDLDDAPFSAPEEFLKAVKLDKVSHIVQYSSSYGLKKSKTLSCHIFMLLDRGMTPQHLKAWLMHLNFSTPVLEKALRLSNSNMALRWPLDITTCQNDKLIYIATPIFVGMKDPVGAGRMQYVKREHAELAITGIELKSMEVLKKIQRDKLNELRTATGLNKITSKVKVIDDYSIQPGAGEASSYEIIEKTDEHTRLNINGGDSGAYWFYNNDFELLRNFKGEDFLYLKDVLPELYRSLKGETRDNLMSNSTTGDAVLAIRDKATGQYWKGLWNEHAQHLELHSIDSKDKLHDFLQGHGVVPPPYVPEWSVIFDPRNPTIVDADERIVNRFVPTKLMRVQEGKPGRFPTIQKFLNHAVGVGEIQEHFLNWLAVIVQYRTKTKTAWILHGTQGTGKGVLINTILRTIFEDYLTSIAIEDLDAQFNQWLERSLIVFVDEIEVDALEKKSTDGKLRRIITEPVQPIRRMRTDTMTLPNFSNFIFASNKMQPVKIPLNDRRYNVGVFQHNRLHSTHHEIENVIPGEVPAFAHYLMTRKADIDKAGEVLKTEDRAAIQALSITSVDELAGNIVSGNLEALLEYMPDETYNNEPVANAYATLMRSFALEGEDKITRDQLAIIFQHCIGKIPEGANKFTTFLRHHGIKTKRIKVNGLAAYGVTIKWQPVDKDFLHSLAPRKPIRRVK